MPKSPKRTVSVAVPLISFPDRVAVAFQVASRSTPWIESVPVRSNRQVPDSGRGWEARSPSSP